MAGIDTESHEFLNTAYATLAFDQGSLLPATGQLTEGDQQCWIDRGDWQSLAAQVGAEKLFFVDRDPVIVFARTEDPSPENSRRIYEKIWCMSRPQLLFLASPGQLSLFDLTKPPPKTNESVDAEDRLIQRVSKIGQIQTKLAAYHRERIETGAVFGEDRFRDSLNRADKALIRNLKTVREQLASIPVESGAKGPNLGHLHSLIGRAIFVRYLEDREILVPSYFEEVASRRKRWQELLTQPLRAVAADERMAHLYFLRVLQDKEFTYALFERLADDFNGDTFPIEDEADHIQQSHLDKLRGFLLGETGSQEQLFFFAYRFDVIPIELISTIYEEFYNERIGKHRNQGSHYTPPALVEFVLANTLTPEILDAKPRVLDPACGSGIFLVESFRRIVRHTYANQGGKRVSRPQLRKILREQIAGIDINKEAVRVAAFSLYLAFLHYQEPREINAERRLPFLKWVDEHERVKRERKKPGGQFFDILLHANSFEVIAGKCPADVSLRFGAGSAAVVVGNPPWGYPKREDTQGQKALSEASKWCDPKANRPIGDKELSQAFIHLSMHLLPDGGKAGLLVSSGVLFKHHKNSRAFRRVWLTSARLHQVVNFAHVRRVFFSGPQREAKGISPFISVTFEKCAAPVADDHQFQYWSAKRTAFIENTQCVLLSKGDMHWLRQQDCLLNEELWKIYWWGGHRDEALVRKLENFTRLIDLPQHNSALKIIEGRGFQEGDQSNDADWLANYRELPPQAFHRYGPIDSKRLILVPENVERRGVEDVYHGRRLLVARGIKEGGFIAARFSTQKFCFRNSIHGIRLKGALPWQEAVLTAIFWSSVARYFLFLTAGSWGSWHDEIHLEDVKTMPIAFTENQALRNRIVRTVQELQELELSLDGFELAGIKAQQRLPKLEQELDNAVFDLYALADAERDLVKELCTLGLEFFYLSQKSAGAKQVVQPPKRIGTRADLKESDDGLSAYIRTFVEIWNEELAPDGELAWNVLSPSSGAPLLAVNFKTKFRKDSLDEPKGESGRQWAELLKRMEKESAASTGSSRIFIDTFFRCITDHEMVFIKRNEQRFWTRSAAREDAESTLAHLMNVENNRAGGRK